MLYLKAPPIFRLFSRFLERCRQNLVQEMSINAYTVTKIFMKIRVVKPYNFRIVNKFVTKISTLSPTWAKFRIRVLNIRLFSASFVKIGTEKAVLFLCVLMKLLFHIYLNPVYFGSKERLYKFGVLCHGLHNSAIFPACASPCVKNEGSNFITWSYKSYDGKV